MCKRITHPAIRYLSVGLILLIVMGGFSSAQTRGVSTSLIQTVKLTASDGAQEDYFGISVSISGDTQIVGAYGDADSGWGTGSVYVFERDAGGPGNWHQVAKLTASDGAEEDRFGWSVSIDHDIVVVGAYRDDDSGNDSGSAYVFEKPEAGWSDMTETAKLTASDAAAGDEFGHSVSVNGDTLVVGAHWNDDGGDDSGSAYVFEKPAVGWVDMIETAKLTASDANAVDHFGRSVSISGDTVVVGAPLAFDTVGTSGAAYVFEKPETGWSDITETTKLTASDCAFGDSFGASVSVDCDTLVVGAYGDADSGWGTGSAYVFERDAGGPGNWGQVAKLTASDGAEEDLFGLKVSIRGDAVVTGAVNDDDYGSASGAAYVFEKPGAGWSDMTETAKLTASDGAKLDRFGVSVSVDGNTLVAGALCDDDNGGESGSAYVFSRFEPVAWVYLPLVLRSAP